VVAETWDGWLNDINGFHVRPEDAWHALDSAHAGPVEEGNVGGGTGMVCNEFKGGIGTASRVLEAKEGGYTVGVLVQCNYGRRNQLRIAGVPVGKEIPEHPAYGEDETASTGTKPTRGQPPSAVQQPEGPLNSGPAGKDVGSIIVIVATDAPLIPTQLKRIAKKVSLGLGRDGSYSGDGSGDIFLAFSTANPGAVSPKSDDPKGVHHLAMMPNDSLDPIFLATVQATEEAVINAMVAAETMKGIDDHEVIALPHDRLREVLKKYNRLEK